MADGAIDKLSIEIGASSTKAINSINRIAKSLQGLQDAMAGENGSTARKLNDLASALHRIGSLGSISIGNRLPDQLKNLAEAVSTVTDDTIRRLDEMTAAIERLKGIDLRGFANAVKVAKGATGQTTALATMGSQAMGKTGQLVPAGNSFTDHDLFMQIQRDFFSQQTGSGDGALDKAAKSASLASKAFQSLKSYIAGAAKEFQNMEKPVKKSSHTLQNFASALKRIAMYRMLRSIIKAITSAFQEGLQNAYTFSQGIDGEGHRFAAAMDSMKSAGLTMKNQLGSAFIALLAAVQPIINTIISLITSLANAFSQFFAVFTGGTYLKATDATAQMADNMAGGAKAAKEWRNQLLGFDEINRLEAPNDGGGSGGGGIGNIAGMFEDTPIDGIFAKMRDKLLELKESLNFEPLIASWNHLKEAVKGFADVVGSYLAAVWDRILVPLAHWVIEEAAPRLVELLATAFEFLTAVLERLKPVFEWVWENVLKPIADFVGDAFLSFLDSVIDLIKKLTDLISGKTTFKEFLESLTPGQGILLALATAFIVVNGVITIFTTIVGIATTVAGLLSAAIAAIASPVGLVILAITALIAIFIAIRQHWDEIVERFKQGGEELRGDWERTKEFFSSSAESIKEAFSNLGTSIAEPFKQGAAEIRADMERIKAIVQSAINAIKQAFESVKNAVTNVFNAIKNTVSNVINSIISMVQRMVSVISNAFSIVGSFGGSIGASIRGYASGGFPEDGLFFANHGEMVGKFSNGKTAVANNSEITAGIARATYDAFMAAFADSSGGGGQQTEFVLNINGREFARAIYNDQNAVQKEYGVSYLASA